MVSGRLMELLNKGIAREHAHACIYKQTIKVAEEEGDITTRRLFEEILGNEEDHLDTFTKLLEK